MPTYEYACKSCGEHLEVVQSFTADPLTVCPACGGPLRKVFGNIGISFKGSGFYRNDSRSTTKTGSSAPDSTPKEPKEPKESKEAASASTGDKGSSSDGGGSGGGSSSNGASTGSKQGAAKTSTSGTSAAAS